MLQSGMLVLRIVGFVALGLAVLLGGAIAFFSTIGRSVTTALLGEARVTAPELERGADIHSLRGFAGRRAAAEERLSGRSGEIIAAFAARPLPNWAEEAKVHAPRIAFAKLMTRRDVEAVNAYLQSARPTGPSGSSWELRPVADYDFTEIVLAAILAEFADRPELLYPETRSHLVNELLIERGYRIRWTVPGSLGMVQETENHILMTEVSRYLGNVYLSPPPQAGDAWKARHEERTARHAERLTGFINELETGGLYEFSSRPYAGYTLLGVLVAEAYAEHAELREAARRLVDRVALGFGLGSHELRRAAPFRRQLHRAERLSLFEDPVTAMMAAWLDLHPDGLAEGGMPNEHHAVIAALLPYRPGPAVADLVAAPSWSARRGVLESLASATGAGDLLAQPTLAGGPERAGGRAESGGGEAAESQAAAGEGATGGRAAPGVRAASGAGDAATEGAAARSGRAESGGQAASGGDEASFLIFIGRGEGASPEIYSIGRGFHLSAGGASFGRSSGIAAMPTVLFASDDAGELDELFHIPGTGPRTGWNNTGVHFRLAVGPQPVRVPEGREPLAEAGIWELYGLGDIHLAVVRHKGFGLMRVLPGDATAARAAFEAIAAANPESAISRRFVDAAGVEYRYDVQAAPGTWVMQSVGGEELPRDYTGWARLMVLSSP
jgi:hypothetical protein